MKSYRSKGGQCSVDRHSFSDLYSVTSVLLLISVSIAATATTIPTLTEDGWHSESLLQGSDSDSGAGSGGHRPKDEEEAKRWLDRVDLDASAACNRRAVKDWAYASNLTAYNKAQATEASVAYSKFWKQMSVELNEFDWTNFKDPVVKRKFKLLSILGVPALPEEKLRKFNTIKQTMMGIYSTAHICSFKNKTNCGLNLLPEITEILKSSRDPEELQHVWVQWRNQTGRKLRKNFTEMVQLYNQAAKLNRYNDGAEFELRAFESETFRDDTEKIWQQLRPLYAQLHAYVRYKLRQFYGSRIIPAKGPIPAHLLGDMWSQSWINLMDIVKPYNKSSIDVTSRMVEKKMTAKQMAKLAEEFFLSLGFPPLTTEFWKNSIFVRPKNNSKMVCHASAWDFCDGTDFRIKQCTRIEMEDLIVLHHEMGHTLYQMQYRDQPKVFRDGANPGFHEAIGDLIALSVQTPLHLREIGLLDSVDDDEEGSINYLLSMALEKVAFLPFAYLVDLWRWNVFMGKTTSENLNCDWWKLRVDYQGIFPPVTRSEDQFDPGSKFHVTANSPYVQYFVSTVLQFQLHKSLCVIAGKYNHSDPSMPFHKCDIYRSQAAGDKLKQMLQLGASKPWPDALEVVTGQRSLDATAILEYFEPLMKWLQRHNNQTEEHIGWQLDPSIRACRGRNPATTIHAIRFELHLMVLYAIACICLSSISTHSFSSFQK